MTTQDTCAPAPADRSSSAAVPVAVPFAAIVLAMLPAVLDQTILSTALPTIASDLGRLTDVAWVVTAYVIAAAAATPLWGKLGDRLGRKRLLELSLLMFLAASALCGMAQDITFLLVVRALQGAAAGGLMTLAMAAVGDLVAPRERARYQGYIAATFAVATIAGPLVGGALVETAGWRWVFYVNLPVGLAALAALRLRLPAGAASGRAAPLDLPGAGLLAAATGSFMLACMLGGGRYAWTSPEIIALAGAAALAAALLAARERRAADPIVPLDLLRLPAVAVASAALFLTTAALFAVNVFVPLYLQTTTGATPTEAGLLLAPAMLGIAVATNYAGRSIARTGRYKRFPVAGTAIMTVALTLLAVAAGHPSRLTMGIGLALFGAGFGLVGQVLIVAVQNAVEMRVLGMAMATTSFARGLGGAVGAALFGALFAARGGVIDGVQAVFLAAAPVAALALLAALLLDEVPLRGRDQPSTDPERTPDA
jgi:EmrB/QacA subfamily drug resistance transporter